MRVINILSNFARELDVTSPDGTDMTVTIPEPAVYVVQKILTNPVREPPEKRVKDISAVKEIIYHIEKSQEHLLTLTKVYDSLSKKQLAVLKQVCNENKITAFETFGK